ncbi:MAG: hypothetical protein PHZ05_09855 [Pygmaiobacter massiliensis]|nr:hypothetical protein [Pygmaiobacter massiliensis]
MLFNPRKEIKQKAHLARVQSSRWISSTLGLVGLPLAAGTAGIGIMALTSKLIEMNSESAKVKNRILKVSLDLDDERQADFDAKVMNMKHLEVACEEVSVTG